MANTIYHHEHTPPKHTPCPQEVSLTQLTQLTQSLQLLPHGSVLLGTIACASGLYKNPHRNEVTSAVRNQCMNV